jgi:hypothetical protein
MSSSRSLWSAPLPLVLLAALVAVLALLLGGSPAGAADHRRRSRRPRASGCGRTRAHRPRLERPARMHADLHLVSRHRVRGGAVSASGCKVAATE